MAEDNGALYYAMGRDNSMNSGNSGNGFGMGGWGDLAALIVVAGLFGWGRGGFGGNGGGGSYGGVADNYVLATDFATIERKIDGVNAGLCDGFYATAQQINGVQQTLCQGFSGINQNIVTNGYETRNAITDVGYALKDCCCATQRAIDGVNYNLATQFGTLNTTLCGLGRDIIENANANYRAIHEELVANKIEAKNERIAELTMMLNKADLKASQEAQNNYLISKLGYQCPQPAYVVQPPQQVTFPTDCCGGLNYARGNNGCGCC